MSTGDFTFDPPNWLEFDGQTHIEASREGWPDTIRDLTIEVWAKLAPGKDQRLVNDSTVLEGSRYGRSPYHLRVYGFADQPRFTSTPALIGGVGDQAFQGIPVSSNEWVFFAMTWQLAGRMHHYYWSAPGTKPGKFTYSYANPRAQPVPLGDGKVLLGGPDLEGSLAQVAIWQTARSEAQVKQDMHGIPAGEAGDDLLAWWPMNEGSGTRVLDHSGRGNHGTISGDNVTTAHEPERPEDEPDLQWATNKVVLQVTRNPQQSLAGRQDSYIFPGGPKMAGGTKSPGDLVTVYPGDEVEWRFTDRQIDSKSVEPHVTGSAAFWASGAPHEASDDPREWVATVADQSEDDEYDFDVWITEGGVLDKIDPGLKCKGRRGKGKGTKTGRVGN